MNRFFEEIEELPDALVNMIAYYSSDGRSKLDAWAALMAHRNRVTFSGMGTSEFSALAVRPRLAGLGVICRTLDAGELLHYPIPFSDGQETIVLVSQSGESVEVKRLVESGMIGDYVAITNDERSTLARAASIVLPLRAGDEMAITTKTYTNTLALLSLMAAALDEPRTLDAVFESLADLAEHMRLVDEEKLAAAAGSLLPCDAIGFVARGPAIACARQGALTFMEGARCPAAAFTGGGFRHGPFEAVGPGLSLIVFAPKGRSRTLNEGLAREAAQFGSRVVLLTDVEMTPQENLMVVPVTNVAGARSEDLFPVSVSSLLPRLLGEFAAGRGIPKRELESFRFGGKVTTREQ